MASVSALIVEKKHQIFQVSDQNSAGTVREQPTSAVTHGQHRLSLDGVTAPLSNGQREVSQQRRTQSITVRRCQIRPAIRKKSLFRNYMSNGKSPIHHGSSNQQWFVIGQLISTLGLFITSSSDGLPPTICKSVWMIASQGNALMKT